MTATVPKNQSSASASGIAMVGAVVTMVANFAIAFLVVKDTEQFAGAFWGATALVTISGTSSALGTNTGLVYFMPQALRNGGTNPRSLVMHAIKVVFPLAATLSLLVFLGAPLIAELIVKGDDGRATLQTMLQVMAPGITGWAVTASLLGATRGLGSMTPTVTISQIFRPAAQTLGIAGVILIADESSAWKVALAWVWPVVIGGVLTVLAVARMGGFRTSSAEPEVSSSEFWSYTKPRSVSGALQIGLERIDVLLITAFLGTGLAGIYGSVSRFATAGNFLIFSVAQAVSPNLRKAIAAEKWESARAQVRQATAWMVMIAWPYFLVVAFKSEAMAGLFNKPELLEGSNALTVLGLGMMASAAAGPVDLTLLMLGKSKASLWGSALAFATDIILVVLLAERFGLVGAAIAWSAAVAVQNGVATVLTRKYGGLFGPGRPSVVAGVGALLAVIPISLVTPQTFVGLLIVGVVAIPLLLGWIYLNRELLGLADALSRGRK